MDEPHFVMEALAEHNPHRIRRPISDLKNIEKDLDEIEARAASRLVKARAQPKGREDIVALSFAAAAGDKEARKRLRRVAGLE